VATPSGRIEGEVRTTDGDREAGLAVTLEGSDRRTTTDGKGRFLFDSVAAGEYWLAVIPPSGAEVRVSVSVLAGRTSRVTVTIPGAVVLAPITVHPAARPSTPLTHLRDVQGALVFSGKKTEVVTLDSITGNTAQDVSRELFARVPGANFSETEHSGFPSNGIGFRGLDATQSVEMNVRQDGVNIVADLYGYPETYYTPPAQAVERITLVRGSSSLQFGPQFGGVVNYELRNGTRDTGPTVSIRQTVGTFGALTSYASLAGGTDRLTYFGYAEYGQQDDGRPNSDVRKVSAAVRLGYAVSDNFHLSAEYSLLRNRIHMPGGLDDAEFAADWRQSFRSRNWLATPWNVLALKADAQLSPGTNLSNTVSYLFSQRYLVWRNEDGGPGVPDSIDPSTGTYIPREVEWEYFHNVTDETRLRTTYRAFGLPQTIATGIRFFAGDLHRQADGTGTTGSDFNTNLLIPGYGTDVHFYNTNLAGYVENIIHLGNRLSLSPGVRVEYLHSTARGHTDTTFSPVARNRAFLLSGMGAEYETSPTTQLYANITEAYRPIEYSFLTPFASVARVNPNLKDPKGYNADLAWRGTLGRAVTFDVGVFYLSYHDRIGLVSGLDSTGTAFAEYTNVANSVHKGVEAYLDVRPFELGGPPPKWGSIGLFNALGYTHARYTTGPYAGKSVEFAPSLVERAGLTYTRSRFTTTFQLSHTAQQFSDANNTVASLDAEVGIIPGYTLADWSARLGLGRFTLDGGINNLANLHYFTARTVEYPGPGIIPGIARTGYLTVSTGF
jgi:Fe(3+) dicitrate transport protein